MNLGVMGTCPGRRQIAPLAIRSIHDQLEKLIAAICLIASKLRAPRLIAWAAAKATTS